MNQPIAFDNSYARLGPGFYTRTAPTPVPQPELIAVNDGLARRMGIDPDWLRGPQGLAMVAGNAPPVGSEPIAQAYAGHQFGGLSPQLGDGRAVLLGEVVAPDGARFDIQLKGSGPTPFSRRGDGRSWLGPVLREYAVSEFMAAAGVPTTRALAAALTGETVWREAPLPGAVLTRVASSHIRVGTFEFFAIRGDVDRLRALAEHVIARHYPDATSPMDLLERVVAAQAETIAQWMALGFIHGVMNTDNMAVSGETIDYGPCAFMDGFHPDKVFSSIDRAGRYAWSEQPHVAVWNLAQLASCLLPLMGDADAAVPEATRIVHGFPALYDAAWLRRTQIDPWREFEKAGGAVMVGEWGAYDKTPHEVILRWAEDNLRLWQEARWGWALWNFRGSFGILDSGREDVRYEEFEGHQLDRRLLDLLQRF